ncbi:MAG: beta-N-acetylhexosaminidase [Rhodospirillaceae bacterium]|nr:beta-N-acetylhexosaminidase [Rhodospirillaceae bacterium]
MAATLPPPKAVIFGLSGLTLTDAERAFFQRERPAGYILFARNVENPEQVTALVKDLRSLDAGHNPVVLIDQEGGRVQRLRPPFWRFAPTSAEFGELYSRNPQAGADALRLNMALIGKELADLGIDVDCAPLLDVPVPGSHDVIGDRAFGTSPELVAALAPIAAEGLIDAGLVPVIKHMPGHGRATADSHKALPVVDADLATLRATDFKPYAAWAALKPPPFAFAMTAHVVYSAIDAGVPATQSRKVFDEIIRGELRFEGLVMSDDLSMAALTGPYDERAAKSLAAGCDVVLHCNGVMIEMEAVARGTGPLGPRGIAALAESERIRLKPRQAIPQDNVAAAEFFVAHRLRRG